MAVTFRPIEASELPAFARATSIGFAERPGWLDEHPNWAALELDRTWVGFDGDDLVATSRNYSLDVTVPGGARLPAAGVSAVTVRPTHRRRGLLRSMMGALLDDASRHDEPLAMLTASEGSIYARFGFGITSRTMTIEIDRRDIEFARPPPDGTLRLIEPDEAAKLEPGVFSRVHAVYPGAVSRPDAWWHDEQWEPRLGVRFDVAYEAPDGRVDGYVLYGIRPTYDGAFAINRLTVRDFVAATPAATQALWRYVCDVDLVRTIGTTGDPGAPLDLALPWMLTSSRAVRTRGIADAVWHRLLDIPVCLGARTYPQLGQLGLLVRDELRPGSRADGAFTLDATGAQPVVHDGGDPDLACDVSALSAAWLGGVRWTTLAAAGLVEERTSGALARADGLFASQPLPYPFTWF